MLERLLADPQGFPPLLAMKTYNPMVYSTLAIVARLTGATLYPSLPGDDRAAALTGAATAVAADVGHGLPFDPSPACCAAPGATRLLPSLPETTSGRCRLLRPPPGTG